MKGLQEEIGDLFAKRPDILYGFTSIEYSEFFKEYRSALVFAVPYSHQLTVKTYNEKSFNDGILGAREILETVVAGIEEILKRRGVKYYVPEVAQKDDGKFRAEFSFKDAAAAAGIGWFGKNDVIITEKYGPRIRLSAILIDEVFQYGKPYQKSLCPEKCEKCVLICPGQALKGRIWQLGMCRNDLIDIGKCNKIRSSFYERLGRWGACALCLAVCPFGDPGAEHKDR